MSEQSSEFRFTVPPRVSGSMTGSEFAASIDRLTGDVRERAVLQQFELGNIPDFMRCSRLLTSQSAGHQLVLEVLPDVLCIGTDEDFLRMPMLPRTAQRIADLFFGTLITPHLNNLLWQQADVRLEPQPMPPTTEMGSTTWFVGHNAKIEKLRAGRTGLIAGIKKNICLANSLLLPEFANRNRMAIHGWHQANGRLIQGLNPSRGVPFNHTHDCEYVDYSHGIYLASQVGLLDGQDAFFADVASDPETASLVNGPDGVLTFLRYPVAA